MRTQRESSAVFSIGRMFVCETGTGEAGEVREGACQARRQVLPAEVPREQLPHGHWGWGPQLRRRGRAAPGSPCPVRAVENIVRRNLNPVLLLRRVERLLVTSTASEFVLAPEKSRAAAWSIWRAYSWASRQKLAAVLQGHPTWLQTSWIWLANSSGFPSVKFHLSVLCVHLNWGWKPQTQVTFGGGNCTARNLNSLVWLLSRANWCARLAGAQHQGCATAAPTPNTSSKVQRGEGISSALFPATRLGVSQLLRFLGEIAVLGTEIIVK